MYWWWEVAVVVFFGCYDVSGHMRRKTQCLLLEREIEGGRSQMADFGSPLRSDARFDLIGHAVRFDWTRVLIRLDAGFE